MKALDVVRRALNFGDKLTKARNRGDLRGEAMFVRVVKLTTAVTEHIGHLPHREPNELQRAALQVAAAQLRHIGATLSEQGALDPETAPGAMTGLIVSTLGLIDELLGNRAAVDQGARIQVRELAPGASSSAPSAYGEASASAEASSAASGPPAPSTPPSTAAESPVSPRGSAPASPGESPSE